VELRRTDELLLTNGAPQSIPPSSSQQPDRRPEDTVYQLRAINHYNQPDGL
jgi:hypothetical protein